MKEPSGLSYSSISTWEQCEWKYMRMYDGGDAERVARAHAPATVEGSLVHDTLEQWYKDTSKDWREILKEVARNNKDYVSGELAYDILKSEHYMGAFQLLKDYTAREDILQMKTLATEVPFHFVLPNGVPVRGKIDRVDIDKNGVIYLYDYKTTRAYMYKDDVKLSLQGMMYVLVAKNFLYPDAPGFKFVIDALRFSKIEVEFDDNILQAAMDYMEIIFDRICALDPADAKPRLNKYCAYCQLQEECPAMQALVQNGFDYLKSDEGRSMAVTPHDVIKNAHLFAEIENMAGKVKSRLESDIDGYLEQIGEKELELGDYMASYELTRYGNAKLKIKKINPIERQKNGKA